MSKSKTKEGLSLLDKAIRYISPSTYHKRAESRLKAELFTRQYDAAQNFSQSPTRRNSNSANSEIKNALAPIRHNVRELIRNAPFARKGLEVIVNGVVGWGVEASIKHPDPTKEEQIKNLWKEWSQGLCSIDGRTDFYQMQNQVMSSVVADGEIILREIIHNGSVRLQILESDFISGNKLKDYELKEGDKLVNGIVVDKYGIPKAYNLFTQHPGETTKNSTEVVDASKLIHVFKQERPGQNRGISWFAAVSQTINMLAEIQWTQLVRIKLAASLTGVVTSEPSQLSPDQLLAQRQEEWALEPGTIKYINPGQKIEFPSTPNPEGFDSQTKLVLREIASGLGITYEALSGDLSQVNFSSGRMGDLQFRANVDQWRWHMLIPRFCLPAFERFKKYCQLKGVNTDGLSVEWVPPARQMINPTEEISSTKDAIRAGLQTLPNALRELGYDPESHLREVAKSNQLIDELGLVFDSDPRRTGNQQLQSPESYQAIKNEQLNSKK